MSEPLSRNTSNGSASSPLSVILSRDNAQPANGSDGSRNSSDDDDAPYVVSRHGPSAAAAGGASRRGSSVVSLSSSSLTDPDDLEVTADTSFATASMAKSSVSLASHADSSKVESEDEEEEEDDADDLVEVNPDGSERPLLRIKKLLSDPPREPKNRWETAYVYAFIERYTSIQKNSLYAPQTVFEFETALQDGGVPEMPADVDDIWVPSLEPIFKDFIERVRRQDRATGGTGGPKGGWQAWIPWWVGEQRALQLPDFQATSWNNAIRTMRDKDDKTAVYKIDWEEKITILKALVDYQICMCEDIKTYINDSYGYVSSYKPQPKTKEEKEQRAKEKAEAKEEARAEAAAAVAAAIAAITAKDRTSATTNDKGKEKEKLPVETDNPLVIRPIGSDLSKQVWYRIDDSPRLYVNSDPYGPKPSFVAVSDTPKEIRQLLSGLQRPPKPAVKLSGPFAKAADGKQGKEKKKKGRALRLENEESLHAYIRDVVLPSLESTESSYFERKTRFENRRTNMIKKIQREARMETLAAQRSIDAGYGSLRSSTRLRRGARVASGYDENAGDMEIEAAIRQSERTSRKRRKKSGTDDDSSDEEYDDTMDLDQSRGQSEEEQFDEDEDEEVQGNASRRSRRAARNGASKTRATIPAERKSLRQHAQPANYYEPLPPLDGPAAATSASASTSRKASVVRGDLDDFDLDDGGMEEEVPFGGLEEVWTMGRYRGYYRPDGTFIKAQKGDIPLYKLAKMGLPLPPLSGPIPGSSADVTGTVDASSHGGTSSTLRSMADRLAAINGEGKVSQRKSPIANNNGSGDAPMEMEDNSLPGRAVPTLVTETEERETDDSNLVGHDKDEDHDDDEESDIITVTSQPKATAVTASNGSHAKSTTLSEAKGQARQEVAKSDRRDISHVQVIV